MLCSRLQDLWPLQELIHVSKRRTKTNLPHQGSTPGQVTGGTNPTPTSPGFCFLHWPRNAQCKQTLNAFACNIHHHPTALLVPVTVLKNWQFPCTELSGVCQKLFKCLQKSVTTLINPKCTSHGNKYTCADFDISTTCQHFLLFLKCRLCTIQSLLGFVSPVDIIQQ